MRPPFGGQDLEQRRWKRKVSWKGITPRVQGPLSLLLALLLLSALLAGCTMPPEEEEPPSSASSESSHSSVAFHNPLEEPVFAGKLETGRPTPPPEDILTQLQELKAMNDDAVGWIVVPGADCSQGVVQTGDNEYYHRRGLDGNYSWLGSIFLDYEVLGGSGTRRDISRNFVVYGHNVDDDRENGKMFAKLINYDDPEYAARYPYVWYYTEEDAMLFYVFAALRTESSNWYIFPNQTDEEFMNVIEEAHQRSEIWTEDIDVTPDDKIITLATCTDQFNKNWTQRWVVMARLARAGEDQEMEITYTRNPNPKKPAND